MARILLVDDDDDLLRAMKVAVEHAGHKVETAQTAGAATELLGRHRFDAVITDVMLPGDGYSVLDCALQVQPSAPVILMTGVEDAGGRSRAFRRGAFEYLHKPISLEKLRLLLERATADDIA